MSQDRLDFSGFPWISRDISGYFWTPLLLTAFTRQSADLFNDAPDEFYYKMLGSAITRELSKRRKLPQYNTIDDAAELLNKSSRIMIITGAGISTSLGIPDFRSKNTGFYSRLQAMGYDEPEDVFDILTFDEDPGPFFKLAGELVPDLERWSPTHEFIKLLQDKNKLLTNYTQNIDNLESRAGISPDKLIQCHGSWATATCRKCKYRVPGQEIFADVKAGRIPHCKQCEATIAAERAGSLKWKRTPIGMKPRKRNGLAWMMIIKTTTPTTSLNPVL